MTDKVPSVDSVIEGFPNQLPNLEGLPTYEHLSELRRLLKENATSVPSLLGGGDHGYLGLVLSAPVYATIVPNDPFNIPARPPALPNIPPAAAASAALTGEIVRQHTESVRQWREYTNVHAALKQQLTKAIPSIYLRAIRNVHDGFTNVSLRELLQHLFTAYGRITAQDLVKNNERFCKEWDPTTPFESVINQIDEAIDYADDGGAPYTPDQIINNVFNIVFKTGMYFDDCKLWNRKATADKTYENMKEHFLQAQQELRAQQQTTQHGGYAHFAANDNLHEQTATALANLATANASDREAFSALVTNNSQLTEQLNKALTEIAKLNKTIQNLSTNHRSSNNNTQNNSNRNSQFRAQPKSYCWTHGYKVSKNHNSRNCNARANGHQENATLENNMGGNQDGKP